MTNRIAALALLSLIACGDDSRAGEIDSSVLTFDAAMLMRDAGLSDSSTGSDALLPDASRPDGGGAVCADLPPAVDSNGILSAFPSIDYIASGADFRIVSTNFVTSQFDSPSGPLVDFFAEVENLSATTECNLFADVTLDGADLIGLVQGPPHVAEILPNTVTNSCVPAFGRAVVTGLIRGVDLSTARTVRIAFDTFRDDYSRAPGEPLLVGTQEESESGWIFEGSVTPTETIYNHSLRVFTMDARGLITNQLRAFPGELATLFGGIAVDFATLGAPCSWESEYAFQGWIPGARSLVRPPTAQQAAMAERRARLAEREEQQRLLRE